MTHWWNHCDTKWTTNTIWFKVVGWNFIFSHLSRLQTSKFSVTSFYVTSFICQVLFSKCTCVYATNFIWQVFIWQVLFTGVNVSTSLLWQFISSQLANHIKCSDYFDKFSLLTNTDEQHLYFDKFFYYKCTCSKASMPAFEQVHLS
jgi:hypothetical protein